MDSIKLYFKNKVYKILKEIKKEEYEITEKSLLRILDVISKTQIFHENDIINGNVFTFSSKNKKIEIDLPSYRESCVVEMVPDLEEENLTVINPILYLRDFQNSNLFDSILYHEVCHLMSIGKWEKNGKNSVKHITGLENYKYVYDKEIKQFGDDVDILSETLNDWIAEKLYNKIENKKYIKNKKTEKYISYIENMIKLRENGNVNKIIGAYFNNDLKYIEKILTTDKLKSFKEITEYLKEKNKNEEIR